MIRNVILDIGDVLVHSDFERFFKKQGYNDDMKSKEYGVKAYERNRLLAGGSIRITLF